MLHQGESDKDADLVELKTELKTVVEALSFLHDFVESVFGAKYHNFVGLEQPHGGISMSSSGCSSANSVQTALRRLQWKHNRSQDSEDPFEISPSIPVRTEGSRRDSRGDNGYSSGGTPVPEGRRSSASSLNKVFSPLEELPQVKIESTEATEDISCRFSMSVGRPEVVAVKYEVEDTDFLDDVDPFGGDSTSYHYEGEESELKIENCYPVQPRGIHQMESSSTKPAANFSSVHCNNPPPSHRFIPELIPIQSDSLLPEVTATIPICKEEDDEESGSTSFSDNNSDTDWHPSSEMTSVSSKRCKQDSNKRRTFAKSTKRSFNPNVNFHTITDHRPSLPPFTAASYANMAPLKPVPSSGPSSGGGPFKCDMCPASYKQEESLRSHQKYKHNPSRIQCTCHLCGKSMVDKYRLQRHLRLHTGEKPFECEYCGQCFYRKDYHTKHLQRKHGIVNSSSGAIRHATSEAPPPPSTKVLRKGKPPPPYSIPSSFQNLMSNIFETPSPFPPLRKSMPSSPAPGNVGHCVTSPSSSSASPGATSSSSPAAKDQCNFVDVFSSHSSTEGGGSGVGTRYDSTSGPANSVNEFPVGSINNLMTMTSLTFDDLISADL